MMSTPEIRWNLTGEAIERESFAIIEEEAASHCFSPEQWRVARRLIHTTGDFGIVQDLYFRNAPIQSGIAALRAGVPILCDANMIRSGLSIARLNSLNPQYCREDIHCYIADPDVAASAEQHACARALCAMEKARDMLAGAIVLIGNSPLALARLTRYINEENRCPALVIGMPVGFVNVVEAKALLAVSPVPHISIAGRRGGSPLAVAVLHAIAESAAVQR